VRLLFDENLSWRLVKRVDDIFPGSQHVNQLGLMHAGDERIWERAKTDDFAIVSKDDDFRQRAMLYGAPPKTIWLRLGNTSTDGIELALRRHVDSVREFMATTEESLLILRTLE
jgi:predicted nuclease of predicted toxin-antitoxin system